MVRPRIVLFGDSITQAASGPYGWASYLAERYARRVDIVNRGYSGYNTRWALHLLHDVLPLPRPDVVAELPLKLVTIFFGANDAALPDGCSARQHVSLEEYRSNLRQMVEHARGAGAEHIILVAPPPVNEAARLTCMREKYGGSTLGPERTNYFTGRYAKAVREVGKTEGVTVLDTWSAFQHADPQWYDTLLEDGLHFSVEGNEQFYRCLIGLIDKELPPEMSPEAMPYDFPSHEQFADVTDVKAVFDSHHSVELIQEP